MTRPSMQDHIDYIMDNFDFERVEKVMEFLEWKWSPSNESPSGYEIKRYARQLLKQVYERAQKMCIARKEENHVETYIKCGGFKATHHWWVEDDVEKLELEFIVSDWDTECLEDAMKE